MHCKIVELFNDKQRNHELVASVQGMEPILSKRVVVIKGDGAALPNLYN